MFDLRPRSINIWNKETGLRGNGRGEREGGGWSGGGFAPLPLFSVHATQTTVKHAIILFFRIYEDDNDDDESDSERGSEEERAFRSKLIADEFKKRRKVMIVVKAMFRSLFKVIVRDGTISIHSAMNTKWS